MKVLVINGPNLNLLGLREPDLYGHGTYDDLCARVSEAAAMHGLKVEVRQSNHEGVIVDWIQQAYGNFEAIILNAAAYTHTSVAILDALKAVRIRTIEVHLTDPCRREKFRHVSYVGMVAERTFAGKGIGSYVAAIEYLAGVK